MAARKRVSIATELRKAARAGDQRKQELLTLAQEVDADIKLARALKTLPAESIRSLTNTRDDLLADAGLTVRRRNPTRARRGHALYYAAIEADDNFQRELERVFGKRAASDARYQPGNFMDAKLQAAYRRKLKADDVLRASMRSNPRPRRKAASAPQRAASKPARSPARRGARRPRHLYRCRIRLPGGKTRAVDFHSVSDQAALKYCQGLLHRRLPKGAQTYSLKRIDRPTSKKKTR